MKYIYTLLLLALSIFTNAQTNPTPVALPYSQDFSALAASSTTYPNGWQGWTISTFPGATFNTAAAASDRVLVASANASATSGNINNYDGKIGFQNTGSLDLSLVVSFVTTGQANIPFTYDVMTIRNPYDGGANTRLNELTLQYRIGNTGSFTNLTGIEYQNNTTLQIGAVTTPQNLVNKTLVLPAACDNKPEVQVRWASRQISGAGSRPSFAIDNIVIGSTGADVTPPTVVSFTPADNAVNVAISSAVSILFSESVQKGTGNIVIKKAADNSIVQTIDVTNATVTVTANTVTIPANPFLLSTGYYVEIAASCFKDLANNPYAGITGNTIWNFNTGSVIIDADFSTCATTLSNGFTAFSLTGPQVWGCTTFGYAGTPTGSLASGVQVNGFASGSNVINEDWLISPSLNLLPTAFPLLSFYSRTAFNGAPLKLKVSTNYTGTGNPALATWTDLNGGFPLQGSDVWKLSQNINLTAFKTANTYVAFVYNSTNDDGARWTLDNVKVDNSLTAPPPTLTPSTGEVNFAFVASGGNAVKTMTFIATDILGLVTLNATGNFLISKTNGSFTPSIFYTVAEANNIPQTVYIRFAPTAPTTSYQGNLTFNTTALADTTITLKGNSIDAATTLDVVAWNLEWFGSTSLGPTNDALQEQNVKTVLQSLAADVYALEEVVSETRLANVVSQMPGYSYVLSNYGSYSNPNQAGTGPLAEAQKLGLIYKTAMFPGGMTTQALLSAGINSAADVTNPAYNWYASGRFPFMVTGTTTLNGATKTIRFIVVHAKANTSPTLTSYQRRKAGNDSLLTHLNLFYPNDNIIMLGDFNDDLDSTITAGISPKLSSYKQFVDDATRFSSPTLALSLSGKKSTVSYNDVIDHVMISNEMQCSYLGGSAAIIADVTSLIPSYGTTTTDHFPVYTRYLFEQPSSATISYSGSPFCTNASTANATFSGASGGTFSSTPGLTINSTTGAINPATSSAGGYVVTYTIVASGCTAAFSTTTNVVITAAPNATINYAGSPYCNIAGIATATRTGVGAGGTYSSTTGLVINATNGDVNTLTSTPSTYTVTYNVAAASGCSAYSTTTTITINSLSTAPTSATASATLICANSSTVTLTAVGGTLGNGASYKWYTGSCGGTLVGTGAVLTNLPITATSTYYVRIEGICNTTTCATVTVTLAAQPVITIVANSAVGFTPNAPIIVTATVLPTDNYVYTWTKNNANIITTPTSTNIIKVYASDAGNYKVTVTAPSGCTATSANVFTASIPEPDKLFIFPNPSSGLFNVAYSNGLANLNGRTINVYDAKGAKVFSKTYNVNVPYENMRVDLRKNAKGVYYVELVDGTGKKLASSSVRVM
jgi:methionine-rich copper-binding protein CopC